MQWKLVDVKASGGRTLLARGTSLIAAALKNFQGDYCLVYLQFKGSS